MITALLERRSTGHRWAYVFPALAALVALCFMFDAESIPGAVLFFVIVGACVLQARYPTRFVWGLLVLFFGYYTGLTAWRYLLYLTRGGEDFPWTVAFLCGLAPLAALWIARPRGGGGKVATPGQPGGLGGLP